MMDNPIRKIYNRLFRRSITRDLTLGLALAVSLILAVIGALLFAYSTYQQNNALLAESMHSAEEIASIMAVPLRDGELSNIAQLAETFLEVERVVELRVSDANNQVLYERTSNESGLIHASSPIVVDGKRIGLVEIATSSRQVSATQRAILLTTIGTVALLVVVISLGTGLLLENFLNRPLRRLIEGIDRVALGSYTEALERAPQIEIDEIAQRVNEMASQIARRIETLNRERDVIGRIMQTSPVGIVMVNRDGSIIFANAQARQMIGLEVNAEHTQPAYNTRNLRAAYSIHNPFVSDKLPFRQAMLEARPLVDVHYAIPRPGRSKLLLSINTAPLLNENRQVDGMVATLEDITERRQNEEDLRKRLRELETVQRISTVLRESVALEEMLPVLIDETLAAFETDTGAIALYDPATNRLRDEVWRGWFDGTSRELAVGEGIAGHVFASGEAMLCPEFSTNPHLSEQQKLHVPSGWGGACVPIRTMDQTLGVMMIAVQRPRKIQTSDLRLLTTLAEIAGNAFHRSRLQTQTELRLRRMSALHTLDMAINANIDLGLTMTILVDQTRAQMGVDAAVVLLTNPRTGGLDHAAGLGFRTNVLAPRNLEPGEGLAGRAVRERQIVRVEDWRQGDALADMPALRAAFEEEGIISYYGLPLIVKDEVKGVLEIFQRTAARPDPEWLDFLGTLAAQAAIAVHDAQLFSGLQRSNTELAEAYDTTLEGWSHALELRDNETEGHTRRVTSLSVALAEKMGLSPEEITHIRRGALLHDIGKMGIPDTILQKPGQLTGEEMDIMRKHPTYAFEMLSPIHYLRTALAIPLHHHERWDGSGYPRGLKGADIPLAARLFAVVDVWDALTTTRRYRHAWSLEKAAGYLRARAGTEFDPQLVEIFLEMVGAAKPANAFVAGPAD